MILHACLFPLDSLLDACYVASSPRTTSRRMVRAWRRPGVSEQGGFAIDMAWSLDALNVFFWMVWIWKFYNFSAIHEKKTVWSIEWPEIWCVTQWLWKMDACNTRLDFCKNINVHDVFHQHVSLKSKETPESLSGGTGWIIPTSPLRFLRFLPKCHVVKGKPSQHWPKHFTNLKVGEILWFTLIHPRWICLPV